MNAMPAFWLSAPAVTTSRVHLGQRRSEAVLAGADVVLAGVVGAVGEPQLQVF
jgi:hypothetical protein